MRELWKKIEYPTVPKDVKHYEVSTFGRVRRGSYIEPLMMRQNGDITVLLLSVNDDVTPHGTPPRMYVVRDLFDAVFNPPLKMTGMKDSVEVMDTRRGGRDQTSNSQPNFYPVHVYRGLNGQTVEHEVLG